MTLVILPSAHCVFSGGRKWNIAASTCEATMHSRAYLGTKENPLRTFGARLRLSRARQLNIACTTRQTNPSNAIHRHRWPGPNY